LAGGAEEQEGLKVILDASSLVSAMLKAESIPRQAVDHITSHPGRLVISQAVEEEYYEVLLRPKFDRFVPAQRRLRILGDVTSAASRVEPTFQIRECPDPDDDKYLSLALAASAEVIISSDKRHLLPMHPWRGISIINPADYLRLHVAC
jgi:uncharacterized protein